MIELEMIEKDTFSFIICVEYPFVKKKQKNMR